MGSNVLSLTVWFTSGGSIFLKANVPLVVRTTGGVMLLRFDMSWWLFNYRLYDGEVAKGIGPSIVGLQSSLIELLNIVRPLGCGASLTTVVDGTMLVMRGSIGIMDLIRLLGVSLALPLFSIVIYENDDV